jgi:uncharacterized membrane protein
MTYEITIILAAGLVTYLTRVSGHLIIAQFGTIHHRLRAALSAVPTAVLTALVAPSFVTQGPAEALAMVVAALVATRQSIIISTLAGLIALVLLRNLGL